MQTPSPANSRPARSERAPGTSGQGAAEPLRTCAGCRKIARQAELVRGVADGAGRVHLSRARRRAAGRGTYVHRDATCLQAALHGGFARSLRRRVSGLAEPLPEGMPRPGPGSVQPGSVQKMTKTGSHRDAASPALGSSPMGRTSDKNQEDHS